MTDRGFLVCAVAFILGNCTASTRQPFPTPHDVATLAALRSNPQQWNGKLVAFEGEVIEILEDRGHPVVKLALAAPSGSKDSSLWAQDVTVHPAFAIIGDRVRILGYPVTEECKDVSRVARSGEPVCVLTFAAVNLTTHQAHYSPEAYNQYRDCEQGHWPSAGPP